jgi:hypothetical protein
MLPVLSSAARPPIGYILGLDMTALQLRCRVPRIRFQQQASQTSLG